MTRRGCRSSSSVGPTSTPRCQWRPSPILGRLATLTATAAFYWSNLGWLRPGLSWLERAVDLLDQAHEAEWARLRSSQGMLAWRLGDLHRAEQSYLDSVTYWEGCAQTGSGTSSEPMIGLAQVRLEQHQLEVAEALNRRGPGARPSTSATPIMS